MIRATWLEVLDGCFVLTIDTYAIGIVIPSNLSIGLGTGIINFKHSVGVDEEGAVTLAFRARHADETIYIRHG